MQVKNFQLKYEGSNSSIGSIKSENISQLLNVISKLIYSIINSFFELGYKLPLNNENFYWTINTVKISHDDGYMYLHATPNFEKIDLFTLIQTAMETAGVTVADLFELVFFAEEDEEVNLNIQEMFLNLFKDPVYGPKKENKVKDFTHDFDALKMYFKYQELMSNF